MLGWFGVLLVITALWYKYFFLRCQNGYKDYSEPLLQKARVRNLDSTQLSNDQLNQFYQNDRGERHLDSCYPDVSDQFAGMFWEQSMSANSGLRIGDVPPEIFY